MGDGATPFAEAGHTVPPYGIDARLASLRDEGGERFDAAGWHYLNALAQRAATHEGSVRRMLDVKLEKALAAFGERFSQARATAAELLAAGSASHPESAAALQGLFAAGDFKGLRSLSATLQARTKCAALSQLVSQLEQSSPAVAGPKPSHPAPASPIVAARPTLELKTVRESRATWARLSVDKQLALAMKQAPQNAGPINSHMLVLRSLALMQAISPDYLSHIVSYADTLLSLDPGEAALPVKRKKAQPPKAAKPGRARK